MATASSWHICRIGFVETMRAVGRAAGRRATAAFEREWASFGVVEVDADLSEQAAALALSTELRSLDALHLAAILALPVTELTVATWDRRLHTAVAARGLRLLPETLD